MEIRGSEKATAALRTMRLAGVGHGTALVLYALVVEYLAASGVNPPHAVADLDPIRTVLLLLSVGLYFMAQWLRRRLLRPDFARLEQALVPGERLKRMAQVHIVLFALCDLVALFGLVLFFLGGGRQDFYPFVALALLFLMILFPRAHQWHAWYGARGQLR